MSFLIKKYLISKNNTSFFHFNTPVIFFMTEKACTITCREDTFPLDKTQSIFLPTNELLSFSTTENIEVYALILDATIVNLLHFQKYDQMLFSQHVQLRKYILKLVQHLLHPKHSPNEYARLLDHLLSLYSRTELITHATQNNSEQLGLLAKEYIDQNYHTEMSIKDISNYLSVSPNHLIKYFKRETGMTILQYITKKRLADALDLLVSTNLTIATITFKSGFPNLKSFTNAFYKTYQETPQQFRTILHKNTASFLILSQIDLYELTQKLARTSDNIHTSIHITGKEHESTFYKTWQEIVTVGSADLLLLSEVREQLQRIQKDMHFSYIRFHDVFSDVLEIYNETQDGTPFFNFQSIDHVLDFIIGIDLIPFIELGFMPKKLAKYPDKMILENTFNTSAPSDIKKWNLLVQSFISHCINRYGLEDVLKWKFEFWNEPSSINAHFPETYNSSFVSRTGTFWSGTQDEYLAFYRATYITLKGINAELQIGGPATIIQPHYSEQWLDKTLTFTKDNHCPFDFLTFHIYAFSNFFQQSLQANKSEENFTSYIFKFINEILEKYSLELPVYITEWNHIFTQLEDTQIPNNDSVEKALYTIDSFLSPREHISGLGYWTFTDYTKTFRKQQHEFADNLGLVTKRGISKPVYHAFTLLEKLGNNKIASGKNYIITKDKENFQMLFYHISPTNDAHLFEINIQQILDGKYERKEYFLNEESGNPKAIWQDMGAPQTLTQEDIRYIKNSNQLKYTKNELTIHDGLSTTLLVEPNSIHFIEYKKIF